MSRFRQRRAAGLKLGLVSLLAAMAASAAPSAALAANECTGVQRCIPIEGPWVAVPATGEVEFDLACPKGGTVAGTDGQASSRDVRATFDANLGAPIQFGRSTGSAVLFRAVSARHQPGSFKPFVGCIAQPSSVRNTIAAPQAPLGPTLNLVSKLVPVGPGSQTVATVTCPARQALVDSWSTTAFKNEPVHPESAAAVQMTTRIVGSKAVLSISVSEALPAADGAEVQLGVRCAL